MTQMVLSLLLVVPFCRQAVPEMEYEGTHDATRLSAELDWSAVLRTWRIKGVLVCTHGGDLHTCLWVENAYPCGLFEAVRQPFRTHLREGVEALRVLEKAAPGLQSRHGDGLEFADVRAWTLVPDLPLDLDIPLAVPRSAPLELDYVSELDFPAWRSEWIDLVMRPEAFAGCCERAPVPRFCAGRWGAYAPRAGFVAQSNEVLASYLLALRGGRVASEPLGRVVLSRSPYEPRTGHYIQMVAPRPGPAVAIGSPDAAGIERNALSPRGAYLFAHFGVFEVCRGCLPVRLAQERMPAP